ncbi:VanZ family protein [Streptococcus marimammalium]|uniref:VanZ family protein n=1 Tax=Streptococcus marimammalium TaxID=269666 RepID=UPI00037EC3BC|nr:VanZ family protein [Streptococcus marimammalium]
MKILKKGFDRNFNPKPSYRLFLFFGVGFYILIIGLLCFTPQINISGFETPGVEHYGRVVVLLTPFNSLINASQSKNIWEFFWIIFQNITNIFLLYPLILGLLFLFPKIRTIKKVGRLSFLISLGIELTQILLDVLIDANRVFEIDDLWTNTLGGLLALFTYQWLKKQYQEDKK